MTLLEHRMAEKVFALRKREQLKRHSVYLITERARFSEETTFLDHVAACLSGGVSLVQLCEPASVPDRTVLSLAESLRSLTWEMEAQLIIHRRVDIASAVQADGVHLAADDLPVNLARKQLGPERMIGYSVHTQAEAQQAAGWDIDYLTVGPVFSSDLLPGMSPMGLGLLEWMQSHGRLSWFAAGGIDVASLPQVLAVGCRHVAVARGLMAVPAPQQEAERFLGILQDGTLSLPG
jgi:thiamine-phosphate pyrophosphorylase